MSDHFQEQFLRVELTDTICLDSNDTSSVGRASVSVAAEMLYCIACIGESKVAIEAGAVSSVLRYRQIVQVPLIRHPFIRGFISHQGLAVPVVDLPGLVGISQAHGLAAERAHSKELELQRLLILQHDGFATAIHVERTLGLYRACAPKAGEGYLQSEWGHALVVSPSKIALSLGEGVHG